MEVATRRREQEVWQACDDLWALSGDLSQITGDAIRERLVALGKSRGSPNEIYKYKKTWVESRGISSKPNNLEEPSDPIIRAVRIVHENLQIESNEKIEKILTEHQNELFKKDEELLQSKKAIDSLMEEYSSAKKELLALNQVLLEKTQEHVAEVEVRKALEREIALLVALKDQQAKSKDELLKELKEAHLKELFKQDEKFKELSNEKKLLGQEYSDNLTAQKMALYNQELLTKEQIKLTAKLEQELLSIKEKILDRDQKITWLIEENNRMADTISQKNAELSAQKFGFKQAIGDRRSLNISLKKAEIEIAKLRVIGRLSSGKPQ